MRFIINSVSFNVLMFAVFLLKPEANETPIHKQTQTKIPTHSELLRPERDSVTGCK